jgi:hypothetical protein
MNLDISKFKIVEQPKVSSEYQKRKEYFKEYQNNNKEKLLVYWKTYRKENREQYNEHQKNWRAKKKMETLQ